MRDLPAIISLDGVDWQMKEFFGEDWLPRKSHMPETRDTLHWRQGTVPGSTHNDLWQLGEIPNPYYGRNSLLGEWVSQRTWIYKKRFFVDAAHEGKRARLRFKGVDYAAQFFLNGELLGRHEGMYTPAIFDVTDRLLCGQDNLLAVVIEPAPDEQPQVGRTSLVRTHKARMNYWWDFCPRLVHLGIWDSVSLEFSGNVRIEDVFVRPRLTEDLSCADLRMAIDLNAWQRQDVRLEILVRQGEQLITSQNLSASVDTGHMHLEVSIPIQSPQLWWPNGHGNQPLYTLQVRVTQSNRTVLAVSDTRETTFGIRQIEFIPNETPDETARPYTLRINGRKIYIKGWNWVPMDVLYGVQRPEKLEHLLALARDAHVNLLRVWGGGLVEREAFYDLCDHLGILVWQEFIQSSSGVDNQPSGDREFVDMMVREAEQIVPLKRNHPSLAIWCGGNELMDASGRPLDDRCPVLGALHEVVQRLDPDRHWLPTSPSGRVFSNALETIAGDPLGLHDVHGPWHHQGLEEHYQLYNSGSCLLHSEFGVEGCTNLETIEASIDPVNCWPLSRSNPVYFHTGAWWIREWRLEEVFGKLPDLVATVHASQFLQAEGLRYAVEADRRRKYRNSGTLPWQFNEPYPNTYCTSAVDYFGRPKPAYYIVARAYEPVHVSAQYDTQAWEGQQHFATTLWISASPEMECMAGKLTLRVMGAGGRCYAEESVAVVYRGNSATRVLDFQMPLSFLNEDIFLLDLELHNDAGNPVSRNRYLFSRTANLAPMLDLPKTTTEAEISAHPGGWRLALRNTGSCTAIGIMAADGRSVTSSHYVRFSDNYFSLLPGESRTIEARWQDGTPEEQVLRLSAWNTSTSLLHLSQENTSWIG